MPPTVPSVHTTGLDNHGKTTGAPNQHLEAGRVDLASLTTAVFDYLLAVEVFSNNLLEHTPTPYTSLGSTSQRLPRFTTENNTAYACLTTSLQRLAAVPPGPDLREQTDLLTTLLLVLNVHHLGVLRHESLWRNGGGLTDYFTRAALVPITEFMFHHNSNAIFSTAHRHFVTWLHDTYEMQSVLIKDLETRHCPSVSSALFGMDKSKFTREATTSVTSALTVLERHPTFACIAGHARDTVRTGFEHDLNHMISRMGTATHRPVLSSLWKRKQPTTTATLFSSRSRKPGANAPSEEVRRAAAAPAVSPPRAELRGINFHSTL